MVLAQLHRVARHVQRRARRRVSATAQKGVVEQVRPGFMHERQIWVCRKS